MAIREGLALQGACREEVFDVNVTPSMACRCEDCREVDVFGVLRVSGDTGVREGRCNHHAGVRNRYARDEFNGSALCGGVGASEP
jgi:hypothetical protein